MSGLKQCEVIGLRKLEGKGNLLAFADIRIGGGIVIRGCAVMNGKNGTFVSMPRRMDTVGSWHDVVIPVDEELKGIYSASIMEHYAAA